MNPRTRLLNALRGEVVDRVPLRLAGFAFERAEDIEQCPDPLRREIAKRVFPQSTYWSPVPSFVNRYLVTPPQRIQTETEDLPDGKQRLTQTIDTPKGELIAVQRVDPRTNTAWQEKYPVENEDDIEKIASIPSELPEDLCPPNPSDVGGDFQQRGIRVTFISSPFVCVAAMMDYQWFLVLALTKSDLILELTEICRRRILDILEVLLSVQGIEYVWLGGSEWVTPPMASPEMYDRYVQEQERSIIAYIHDNSNAIVHVHCHGRIRHALERMIQRGADYTEPVEPPPDGDITMAEAKSQANGRITLGGNVECRVLCNESEEATERAVRAAFAGGKRRFVLRPTEYPSPSMSEQEYRNYMRMIDLWEELSPLE